MPIFVIHHHFAKKEHWDLRLEIDNVLKSWALPKEPPIERGIRRLAVQVEDHPLDYSTFEGEIPKGFYGAGKVVIWDRGECEIIKLKDNEILFKLNGSKVQGDYALIKIKNKFKSRGNSWLFFKR